MKIQKGTVFGLVALVVVSCYIGYSELPQQFAQASNHKIFRHAELFKDALDGAQYQNNDPISYSGTFDLDVEVTNWADVKALDKLDLIAKAELYGYDPLP